MMDNWGGYGMAYGNPWGGLFLFIFMVVFLVMVVAGAMYLLRRTAHVPDRTKPSDTNAVELLNQRYAKGEITRDEYRSIKKDIG